MSSPELKNGPASAEAEPRGSEAGSAGVVAGGGNIDQIREILFGVQMEEYERRFTRLEERVAKEAADLRSATTARLDSLEDYVKRELKALAASLKSEQGERAKAVKGVSRELESLGGSLEKRIEEVGSLLGDRAGALDAALAETGRELRERILEHSKTLREELAQARDALGASIAGEAEDLRARKVDRTMLAALLTETAARLADEPRADGGGT